MNYLCSPYTCKDSGVTEKYIPEIKEHRYREALRCLAYYTSLGEILFSPIVHSHPMSVHHTLPGDWEFWQKVGRDIISRCDELWILMIDSWRESIGIRAEVDIAYPKPVMLIEPMPDGQYQISQAHAASLFDCGTTANRRRSGFTECFRTQ